MVMAIMAVPLGLGILVSLIIGCAVGIVFMAVVAMSGRQTTREDDEDQLAELAEWRKLHWRDDE